MNAPSTTVNSNGGKRRRLRNVITFRVCGRDYTIDEDDYRIVSEITAMTGENEEFWTSVDIREGDPERRVHNICWGYSPILRSLPPSIGQLQNLKKLDISHTQITTLPHSIGKLQNLEELRLFLNKKLTNLPESIGQLKRLERLDLKASLLTSLPFSIGQLQNLKYLNLGYTDLSTLPSSIGQLKNLKELDLGFNGHLKRLPVEIGNLTSLTLLDLNCTNIASLPHTIGGLQNLGKLICSGTKLTNLPNQIGDLTKLKELDMSSTAISSIPPSIGRLQNLELLDLSWNSKLTLLPEEIGDLASLKKLDLYHTNITTIPSSIGRLKRLKHLNISMTLAMSSLPEEIGNLTKLERFHRVGHKLDESTNSKLWFALLCNGARARTGFGTNDEETIQEKPKLWPFLLNRANVAFGFTFQPSKSYDETHILSKPTAIYQLLILGRGSFVKIAMNRKANDIQARTIKK